MSDRRPRYADSAAFRNAMGALSSGVAIIACGEDEARAGCTATSLASLSLAPPTLLVCLARSSTTLARLREARAFSISLLAARHQALAHRFSGHSGVQGPRRFELSAMDHTLDRRPDPFRCDCCLRLSGRGGHRAPFPCDCPRRRRQPQGRRRRTGSRAPPWRIRNFRLKHAIPLGRGTALSRAAKSTRAK